MNKIQFPLLSLALACLPLFTHANSFKEATQHLDLDGSLVGYMDFEGDGSELGNQLNSIYTSVRQSAPEIPPIPIDFTRLFENLGFGSIRAIAVSSKEIDNGLFVNRYATLLHGEPKGLFALYGTPTAPLTTFTAASQAPADATGAVTGTMNWLALRDSTNAIMQQIMGPTGEALLQQQLSRPIPGTDLSVNELVEALSGRVDFIWQQTLSPQMEQSFKIRASFEGAAPLLTRLKQSADSLPIIFTENASGTTADCSALIHKQDMRLFLFAPTGSEALILYTHPEWNVPQSGHSLAQTDEFLQLTRRLPESAHNFSYHRGFDLEPLFEMLNTTPQMAQHMETTRKTVALLIGDFLKPNVTAMTLVDDALLQEQYASYSTKQIAMAFPAAFVAGLASAVAIPLTGKVTEASQHKAILNNLRQIASASHQYFLETGATSVRASDLVGPDAYIRQLHSVQGENYSDLVITTEMDTLSIHLPNGETVTHTF